MPTLQPSPTTPTAPSVSLDWPSDDPMLAQVAERLALLARSTGLACQAGGGGHRLLRFRPESRDPALALLELATLNPELAAVAGDLLAVPELLSPAPSERALAAIQLERHWLDSGLVLPLMTTQHWLAISRRLHDVELSSDGVPLLSRAWANTPLRETQP